MLRSVQACSYFLSLANGMTSGGVVLNLEVLGEVETGPGYRWGRIGKHVR